MQHVERFVLPIRKGETLKQFLLYAFGVTLPDQQICANHSTPFRAFADAYFAKSPIAVWKASRGFGGKTFTLALLTLTEALTLKASISLLGGSGEQSKRALEHTTNFMRYQDAPRQLLRGEIGRETRFAFGNQIEALMASQASVRGPHPQRLRIDEVDETDLAILDAALGQPMSANGIAAQTVLSSTHQNADGTMTEILKRAADKHWSVHEWCWREVLQPYGWLLQSEIDRKRVEVSAAMWANEYDLQEPSPGSRAIDTASVREMFKRELGEFAGEVREYIEIEESRMDTEYFTGADWAKHLHYTVIMTFKRGEIKIGENGKRKVIKPHRLIAFERLGRENWNAMIDRYQVRLQRFHSRGQHDLTGIGDVIDDQITVSGSEGFDFRNAKERARMLNDYCVAIENHEIESPLIHYMESEHRLASVDDVYGTGHLPDTISAGALAYRAASKGTWWLA